MDPNRRTTRQRERSSIVGCVGIAVPPRRVDSQRAIRHEAILKCRLPNIQEVIRYEAEARMRRLFTRGRLITIGVVLLASSASSQSELDGNAQNQLEQSCIAANIVDSMGSEAREAVLRVCHGSSLIEAQLTERLESCEHECDLGRAALEWARSQGFEECIVGWTRTTNYKDVLVVIEPGITDRRMWTQDVPLGLSRFSLPEGRRLCKWGFIGGPSAVIDSSGSEVSFFLTDWVEG